MTKQIHVVPEVTVPIPVDLTPQEAKTLVERTRAAFNTAEFLIANGHPVTSNIATLNTSIGLKANSAEKYTKRHTNSHD